jgi:transposase-like protein
MAIYIMCNAKKGVSALQLQRMLDIKSYKSAWFMCHRIRYAMTQPPLVDKLKGIVEADEIYIGGKARNMHRSKRDKLGGRGTAGKAPVFALVERGGQLQGLTVANVTGENLKGIMRQYVSPEARIMTDEHGAYKDLDQEYASHERVVHSQGEHVNGDAHTNTLEGAFSLFKRQIVGAHHHVSVEHLPRYW